MWAILRNLFSIFRTDRTDKGLALINAVFDGQTSIVTTLLEQYGAEISGYEKGLALGHASERGYAAIVAALLNQCNSQISDDDKGWALKQAVRNDHTLIVTALLNQCNSQILDEHKGWALKHAAFYGYAAIVTALLNQCNSQISGDDKGLALSHAAFYGYAAIVTALLNQCNSQISDTYKGWAFQDAAKNGHIPIITDLLAQCNNSQILDNYKGWALKHAAKNGHTLIVTTLLNQCNSQILGNYKGWALKHAAKNGHTLIVTTLLDQCNSQILDNYKGCALKHAAFYGYAAIVTTLLDQCNSQISGDDKGLAFRYAAFYGYAAIVTTLLNQCNSQILDLYKSAALSSAAKNGHTLIVTVLLGQCSAEISSHHKKLALQHTVLNGDLEVLNALLADQSVLAEVTFNNNFLLREARSRAHGPDAARYQAIVDRLRQIPAVAALEAQEQHQAENLADIVTLAENATDDLTAREESLLRHLKSQYGAIYDDKGWEQLRVEILSYLESKYQAEPAREGYSRVWMLEQDAQIPVTFLPSDTIGLQPKGDNCVLYWQDDEYGYRKVVKLAEVLAVYEGVGDKKGSPYLYRVSQEPELLQAIMQQFGIPVLANQNQPLPLEKTENLSPQALTAYYRHPIHNAWRYLSDSNPWMANDAAWVAVDDNQERTAVISEADKALIGYFWLALNDEKLELEPGFTLEGNLEIFANTIAELNRGHNVDERALYKHQQQDYKDGVPEIQTTREDNLEADKPTCKWGVAKRFFQSEYGHPLTRILDIDILRERMLAQVIQHRAENELFFTNLFDRLDTLSMKILQHLKDEIDSHGLSFLSDACSQEDAVMLEAEEASQKKAALSIPEEQLASFIENAKRNFLEVRITEKHPEKLKDDILQESHESYETMVQSWAQKPLLAFSEANLQYLNTRIAQLQNPPPIVINAFDEDRKRKHEDDASNDEHPKKKVKHH